MTPGKPTLARIAKFTTFPEIENATNHIFNDAQLTLSGHRKLVMLLRRIQVRAVTIGFEEMFTLHFTKLVSKIFKQKKGVNSADRIAKFCSNFVAVLMKEEEENPTVRPASSDSGDEVPEDGISSEFADNLIRFLLRGIESKSKDVRYRVVQLLAYLVIYITEIEEQLFRALHFSLNRRLHDKESMVRIQAVVAISRFQIFDEIGEGQSSKASDSIIHAMNNDDSPEVRRAALLNMSKIVSATPELVKRARDVNVINRRLVYSRVSRDLPCLMDLEPKLREDLLKWGIHDRDESVKSAAITMLSKHWLGQCQDDILELLEALHVVESDVAASAIQLLFEHRRDKFEEVQIPPETWKELTVEKAFFVRHYFEFCHQKNLYDKIEQYLPELMRLAFLLDQYLKLRQSLLDKNAEITQEHLVFEKKSIKYDRLIEKGVMEIRDLTRRLDRETSDVAQLRLRQDELRSQISENKSQTHTLRSEMRRKPELKDANSQKINHLHLDIKDSMSQVESNSASIMESLDVIEQIEAELSNSKRAQSHRTDERDAFLDSSLDFLERYAPFEEQLMDLDFVIEQLLSIIKSCDSADVAGMRRIMPIVTKAMTNSALNDKNLKLCVEILRKGSDDENYFSQLCTEIITDIRDSVLDENDETFMSAHDLFGFDSHNDENESALDGDNEDSANDQQSVITDASQDVSQDSSKRRKVGPVMPPDHILIQCLTVLQYYLEIAEDTRANSHQLDTLIDTLIRPALTNNENAKIRLLGYRTLGLFTLIDEGLGISNLKFFGISASKAHDEDLKILCMNTIFDILFTHGVGILDAEGKDAVDSLSLARLFYSLIKLHDMPKLQATVAEGLCKLFLADLLVDFGKGQADDDEDTEISQEDHLLEVLLFSYFHPLNAQNQDLRQTLAFCIPVYCFSHEKHQLKVSSISADCFYRIFKNEGEFEKFGASLSPTNVLQQLIYWCDPHNIVNITQEALQTNMSHFWQAIKLLQIVEQDSPRNVKKAVIQNLNKLSLSESLGQDVLRGLLNAIDDTKKVILDNQSKAEFVLDASCDRALEKFNSYVEDLLQIAEKLDASSSNTQDPRAMALSVSGEIPSAEDVASGEIPLAEDVVKDEIPHVGDTDTNDIPLAEELGTHANDILLDTGSPEKPQAQTVPKQSDQIADLVASELADIDKMLEDEDEVEYDIDGIDM